MAHIGRGLFVAQASIPAGDMPLEYKYEVVDANGNVACSEQGKRKVKLEAGNAKFVVKDEAFNYPNPVFKGAGVAIPGLFSLVLVAICLKCLVKF
jgi:hypothetical protein